MYKSLEGFRNERSAMEINGMQRKGLYIRFAKQFFEKNPVKLHVYCQPSGFCYSKIRFLVTSCPIKHYVFSVILNDVTHQIYNFREKLNISEYLN